MENNGMNTCFNNILTNVSPHFKNLRYKKTGNNYKYFDNIENIGKIINFQKSQWDTKENISFTINIGLYLPEFEYYHIGKISNEKFIEPICAVRKRIGYLKNGPDYWYDLNNETNIDTLINDIEYDIENIIIPYLNNFKNKNDVLEKMLEEENIGYYEFTRIRTLYKNGYGNEVIKTIGNDNYKLKYKLIIDKINHWIKENKNNGVRPNGI